MEAPASLPTLFAHTQLGVPDGWHVVLRGHLTLFTRHADHTRHSNPYSYQARRAGGYQHHRQNSGLSVASSTHATLRRADSAGSVYSDSGTVASVDLDSLLSGHGSRGRGGDRGVRFELTSQHQDADAFTKGRQTSLWGSAVATLVPGDTYGSMELVTAARSPYTVVAGVTRWHMDMLTPRSKSHFDPTAEDVIGLDTM